MLLVVLRAWDISEQKYWHWKDSRDYIIDAIPNPWDEGNEWTENCIVEQHTGHVDKVGIMCFVGDIFTKNGCRYGVVFDKGSFCAQPLDKDSIDYQCYSVLELRTFWDRRECLIVGHIHESKGDR